MEMRSLTVSKCPALPHFSMKAHLPGHEEQGLLPMTALHILFASTTVGAGWQSCYKLKTRQPQVALGEAERVETVPLQPARSTGPAGTREQSMWPRELQRDLERKQLVIPAPLRDCEKLCEACKRKGSICLFKKQTKKVVNITEDVAMYRKQGRSSS